MSKPVVESVSSGSDGPPEVVRHELTPRMPRVRRVERLSPRMVRVTVHGPDLAGFVDMAPADHVKVFFPTGPGRTPAMPELGPEGMRRDPAVELVYRDYTVRAFRPETLELDLDFALHGEGPGAGWAAAARPGDPVGVLGPRGSVLIPTDLDWYLIAGDETALPAVARWLERLPATAAVTAFVEVADPGERIELTHPPSARLTWVCREGGPREAPTDLFTAIRGFTPPTGRGFAWVAGEAGALRDIRRYLRQDLGLHRDSMDVDGYWRRGEVNFDHHAPQE